ncbi:MAG: DUF2330 domain-containing protein [Chloroflexi bacterium]|nr:DUF2330 domain-containing protein [Chloroflexota bacterium]
MRQWLAGPVLALAALALTATPALACAGLIGPNGAVNVTRTTTLAAYADGVEHYVTSFSFEGGGAEFGSLIPLPGIPTKVERGGAWTLQRLIRETEPVLLRAAPVPAAADARQSVEVLLTAKIDAIDITVIRGDGAAVGEWAKQRGFRLSPDAPEILDFYAERSPIFLAAAFDGKAAAARGQRVGDGTPVHLTIPVAQPWVPLRILTLGKAPTDTIDADVFLLTPLRPAILPGARAAGLKVLADQPASASLLKDLRSDEGMSWIPESAWLTKVRVRGTASQISYDLAVDPTGVATPSRVAAGLERPSSGGGTAPSAADALLDRAVPALLLVAAWLAAAAVLVGVRRRA